MQVAKCRTSHRRQRRLAAIAGNADAHAFQDGTRRSARSRPAKSFEAVLQPFDVFKIFHFLHRRRIGYIDPRKGRTNGSAERKRMPFALDRLMLLTDHEPQSFLDQGRKRPPLGDGLAFCAREQVTRQSDSRSLDHMSKHICDMSVCQSFSAKITTLYGLRWEMRTRRASPACPSVRRDLRQTDTRKR